MGTGNSQARITTGSLAFDGGVNSGVVPTLASEANPTGLRANQLAWANSCTVRGAGISPRQAWRYRLTMPVPGLFQGGYMYEPDFAFPYLVVQIAGRTFQIRVDTDYSVNEITIPGDPNPPEVTKAYFVQGEQFLVQQAGDLSKLPQFWDGVQMVRSRGITANELPGPNFTVPAIGGAVLANLTGPYTGGLNQEFLIDGYRYRQIDRNQRYQAAALASGGSVGLISSQPFSLEVGFLLLNLLGGAAAGTVVGQPLASSFSGAGGPPYTSDPFTTYIADAAGLAGITYSAGYYLFPNGSSVNPLRFSLTADPLAPTVGNQVWLINVDDSRAGTAVATNSLPPQLPSGFAMDYYMGRIWVSAGREYVAGDIVGGPSGTAIYDYRDSILMMTENAFTVGGGAFIVPSNAGNIRAMNHAANIDERLSAAGEGTLKVFTAKSIYSVNVTPLRAQWAALSEPLQRIEQINYGAISDRSVVPVNGDLYYRSIDGVRSLKQAILNFGQPGNTPLSEEMERVISRDDKSLIDFCSAICFDNRLLMTAQPFMSPYGVAHRGVMALNFDLASGATNNLPPAWEGVWEGANTMQMWRGDYGGLERAFAMVYSAEKNALEIWELTNERFDTNTFGEARPIWAFETPSYTWKSPFQLKQLDTLELWVDRVYGTVDVTLEFKPDQSPCWVPWHTFSICAARNECELPGVIQPCDYPSQQYRELYNAMLVMPKPPTQCESSQSRPANIGFSFQFRFVFHGFCRVRGLIVHGYERGQQPYQGMVC